MNNFCKKAAVAAVLAASIQTGFSQTSEKINIVTTAVPFLRISPDARSGGLGDAGVATSPDAFSQFYNVAKYAAAESPNAVGANYAPWLRKLGLNDVYLASLAGYHKLDDKQAISGSLKYFSLGNIQLVDQNGNDLSQDRPREFSLDAGYSRMLSDRLSLGIALRYIHSNLGTGSINGVDYKSGNAVAGDLGVYYSAASEETGGWSFGAVLSNLGSKIAYTSNADHKSFLPANFGLGVAHSWVVDTDHRLTLTGEINKLLVPAPPVEATEEEYRKYTNTGIVDSWLSSFDNKITAYSAGFEYTYNKQFAFRAGYYTDSRNLGVKSYLTTGFGINYQMLEINFSYLVPSGGRANVNPLSNTLRFGLVLYPGR